MQEMLLYFHIRGNHKIPTVILANRSPPLQISTFMDVTAAGYNQP